MERINFYLYFFFILLCPVSLHPVEEHLVMSDLSPYSSLHGPEQIHIAYGDSPSEMMILWSTSNSTELGSSVVLYGLAPKNYSSKAEGKFVLFTEGNPDGLKYIHRVVLQVRFCFPFTNYVRSFLFCSTTLGLTYTHVAQLITRILSWVLGQHPI